MATTGDGPALFRWRSWCVTRRAGICNNGRIVLRPASRLLGWCCLTLALAGCDAFDFGRVLGAPSPSTKAAAAPSGSAGPAPKARASRFVVIAGGDVALGGNVASFLHADKDYDPLSGLRPILEGTNLRVASLVSPLSDRAAPAAKGAAPTGRAHAADALARAGVDALSVANPELWSYGEEPFADTLSSLAHAKIAALGGWAARTDPGKELSPAELSVDGWSIALFAVATWPEKGPSQEGRAHVGLADPEKLAKAIREARPHHDLVLVSHHAGRALSDSPGADQLAVARAAIEAGADAVFDQGAHVPAGVAWISGRPAFYGLGNLVADEDPKNPWTGRSYLARIAFGAAGSEREVDACPYMIVDGEPKLLAGVGRPVQEAVFHRAIAGLSEPFGGTRLGEPDLHSCMRLRPTSEPVTDSSAPP